METILVQETNSATLDVLTIALESEGYAVQSLFEQSENILDMIKRYNPKLILLDCWFSNYSDSQINRWIKAHFPSVPVIALSCDNRIDEKYRQFGFDDYLKMPFDLEMLYATIGKYAYRVQSN